MQRSVVCPGCNQCFCSLDEKTKKAFWEKAPPAMRNRKTELSEPLPPEKVNHPLVLFADDDPTSRAIMRRVGAALKINLMVLANGAHLVEVARRYRPELVITDALMPGMDGREASKVIKSEVPQTRIVVITSVYKGLRYKNEAMREFGADEYLEKPVTPEALRDAIQRNL
jgi:CheY-like chemotaxis protein